jgi:hypothetical protein
VVAAMIFDTDDLHETNHRLDLLQQLRDANPLFRMTAFAIPGLCSKGFLDSLPDWIEVGAHGWMHGGVDCSDAREAENWTNEETREILLSLHQRFVKLWKSPGWQISDGTYQALLELDWACADQAYNDTRRPVGLRVHRLGDGDHLHGHIQDIGSNGLAETWSQVLERVTAATSFQLVSEAVQPWTP